MSAAGSEISIVVPVRNGAATLGRCLAAAVAQDPPAAELVVVDDASDDETPEIARQAGCTLIRLAERRGAAGARNCGARAAHGGILLFVDADMVLPPTAAGHVLDWFSRHDEYSGLVGLVATECPEGNATSVYFNLRKRFDYLQLSQPIAVLYGGLHALRRAAFEESGGYDESFPEVEDADLGRRLADSGRLIGLDPSLEGIHLHRIGLLQLLRSDLRRTSFHVRLLRRRRWSRGAVAGRRVASFRRGALASVVVVPLTVGLALGAVLWAPLAAPAVVGAAAIWGLNRRFLAYVRSLRGGAAALTCGGILVLDMVAAAAGAAVGVIAGLWEGRRHER